MTHVSPPSSLSLHVCRRVRCLAEGGRVPRSLSQLACAASIAEKLERSVSSVLGTESSHSSRLRPSTVLTRQCLPRFQRWHPISVIPGPGSSAELTVILRHIPTHCSRSWLVDQLNIFKVPSDLMYWPVNVENVRNMEYANSGGYVVEFSRRTGSSIRCRALQLVSVGVPSNFLGWPVDVENADKHGVRVLVDSRDVNACKRLPGCDVVSSGLDVLCPAFHRVKPVGSPSDRLSKLQWAQLSLARDSISHWTVGTIQVRTESRH